jgi:hypothetical protein
MRGPGFSWCCLLVVGCAHTVPQGPSLAGAVGPVKFDRQSVSGPFVMMSRTADGDWSGRWRCGEREQQGVIPVGEDAFQVGQVRYGLVVTPLYVGVHETFLDLVFRREDGGAIPHELLVPLWIALRQGRLCARVQPPSNKFVERSCVEVEGIGLVEALIVPGRVEQTALHPPRCHGRVGEAPPPAT